jgi:hypothetical protein
VFSTTFKNISVTTFVAEIVVPIKQCTEKETTSHSIFLLTIKLNYLHDLKIMFQCSLPHVIHTDSTQYNSSKIQVEMLKLSINFCLIYVQWVLWLTWYFFSELTQRKNNNEWFKTQRRFKYHRRINVFAYF